VSDGRVTIEEHVVYGTGGGRELRCDVYTPPGEVRNAPAVLLVHGGAWRSGDRTQLRGYGILLGRAGYVCVAPEYRLVTESPWPAAIQDVKAAIRWVRANATKLGVDPDRIAIEGNSAGAHLALLAAATPGEPEFEGDGGNPGVPTDVAAVLAVYPPTVLATAAGDDAAVPWAAISDERSAELAAAASPLTHVRAGFPPTLLIHGTADTTVPVQASIRMYEKLAGAGVPVDLHLYAEQPHAFDAQPEFGRHCAAEMLLFLGRYVRERVAAG
jgi:acetyl esterase/lipase